MLDRIRSWFPARAYSSGTRWCAWRWTDVAWRGALYLVRLHLFQVPRGAVMLHWILTPDPHPDPHDHPVDFLSITLRGGYTEWTPKGYRSARVRFRRATDVHRIVAVKPGTVTLVLAGPVVREWGFWARGLFVPWRFYREHTQLDEFAEDAFYP
jgi:hypothetical protein